MVDELPLRKCRYCGLEANTKEDLHNFTKHKDRPYGYATICKACTRKKVKEYNSRPISKIKKVLNGMMFRCYNPLYGGYKHYGGKGVEVCDEWKNNKRSFVTWALNNDYERGLQIDRINNNGNYSPDNCRWVTHSQNQRNKSVNVTDFDNKTRVCCICHEKKPIEDFSTDRGKPLGKHYYCKICYNIKYG